MTDGPGERHGAMTTPDGATARQSLVDHLRQSLRRVIAGRYHEREDELELRRDLRGVCARARREGVRAEHLLILLKRAWRELPERLSVPRTEWEHALARVATACINEYYQDGGRKGQAPRQLGTRAEERGDGVFERREAR